MFTMKDSSLLGDRDASYLPCLLTTGTEANLSKKYSGLKVHWNRNTYVCINLALSRSLSYNLGKINLSQQLQSKQKIFVL